MRFRLGLVTGFGVGYYLGAMAGRERYEQLRGWLGQARESEIVQTAAEKAKAVADLGVERVRDAVGGDDDEDPTTVVVASDPFANGRGTVNSGLPTPGAGQ
ncbi:MAG TPA: hypothetical protein VGB14_18090 [Acidimicrobiales bacterium]|jgi:hypothetical protein